VQHGDFLAGRPPRYHSRPSTLNFRGVMGSGAIVLA